MSNISQVHIYAKEYG